ncbi:hypothetical protein ACFQDN_19405 [Pseudomonas asuensis]
MAARYVALLASLIVEQIEDTSAVTKVNAGVIIETFTQRDNVLIASLFDGLLSTDEQANNAFAALKQTLAVLSKVGSQSVH